MCVLNNSFDKNIIRFFFNLYRFWHDKDFPKRYGASWAVITGASDGIGRSYAFKLAERNMNVFLISRSEVKLQNVAQEIEELYCVKTKCYPMDCSTLSNPASFAKLKNEIDALDVGLLVNNVGIMYEKLQYFLTVPKQLLTKIIDLNIHATVLMTNLVLPQMVSRKNGAIINLSSSASINPTPLMTTYSAAKSFVRDFTIALEYEYASQGITMQVIHPSFVSTNMTYMPKSGLTVPSPDTFVESAIRTLGVSRSNYGYWVHGILGVFVLETIPLFLHLYGSLHFNPVYWSRMTGVQCG